MIYLLCNSSASGARDVMLKHWTLTAQCEENQRTYFSGVQMSFCDVNALFVVPLDI